MFQQRPMPPMNSRGFFPGQGQMPMGRSPLRSPFMGGGQQFGSPMPTRGAGGLKGLISRFIPGSQGAAGVANTQGLISGVTGASRATSATGGVLQGLTNPANISGMLGNVQKVLGMAQQVTPMVQQYGPLVKNLPAMLKIYRELKNGDSDDTTTEDVKDEKSDVAVEEQPKPRKKTKQSQSDIDPELDASNPEAKTTKKGKKRSPTSSGSKPKMYI